MNPQITIIEHRHNRSYKRRFFTVNFFNTQITVTVTSSSKAAKQWISTTLFQPRAYFNRERLVVGLGVQWNPQNGAEASADTLQLCAGTRCLIFQLSQSDTVPRLLRRFLLDGSNTFVGLWNGQDEKRLLKSDHELRICRIFDVRSHVGGGGLARASVERIVRECLAFEGVKLEKEISRSDWDRDVLRLDKVKQACVDAYVAFEIGKDLRAWDWES